MTASALKVDDFTPRHYDVLWCLFLHGPTRDGDLPCKASRTWLVEHGFVDRADGWNWLTSPGTLLATEIGMAEKKDRGTNV